VIEVLILQLGRLSPHRMVSSRKLGDDGLQKLADAKQSRAPEFMSNLDALSYG
jgi:hypothetical protein